ATRKLLKEGVDFIKIMASGGGTQGTDSTRASYTVEEMAAATFEAHQVGKKATAHTLAAESVERAVEAGLDQIEHFNFLHPDGSRIWDQVVADKIVQNGMVLSPTIQTGYRQIETLQNKAAAEDEILTELEEKQLAAGLYKLETKLEFIGRFKDMGAPIVAGTDAISVFGDYAVGLELFHRAGLSPMEVIISATSLAAKAIGVEDELGTVKPGMLADFIYLDGDPLENVQKLNNVETVVLNGKVVVDKRLDMAVGLPALADGDVKMSPIV
ncbi:MAG: amidohydrolase family protein, partial [Anaerolineales bacterium]|nr:amidohydrolase family protein [Anaerolineales bacterium]